MLNVAALNGRLTAQPELKHTQSDVPVCSFTIAVDRSYHRAGQERQADFIGCIAWRGTAEFISKNFQKGQLIAIEGHLQTRSYTDSQGSKRKVMEVVITQAHFAGPKRNNEPTSSVAQDSDFVEIDGSDDLPF